jgi:hypothetical protein
MTQPNFPLSGSEDDSEPKDGQMREDEALPAASEDEVLNETARLAREGRRQLEEDEDEPSNRSEDKPKS